jgi:hypothetical protein
VGVRSLGGEAQRTLLGVKGREEGAQHSIPKKHQHRSILIRDVLGRCPDDADVLSHAGDGFCVDQEVLHGDLHGATLEGNLKADIRQRGCDSVREVAVHILSHAVVHAHHGEVLYEGIKDIIGETQAGRTWEEGRGIRVKRPGRTHLGGREGEKS